MWSRMMFHCYTGTCLMMLGMNVVLIYSGLLSVNSCNVNVTHFRWRIALYSLQFFDWCLCNLCFCILNVCKMSVKKLSSKKNMRNFNFTIDFCMAIRCISFTFKRVFIFSEMPELIFFQIFLTESAFRRSFKVFVFLWHLE